MFWSVCSSATLLLCLSASVQFVHLGHGQDYTADLMHECFHAKRNGSTMIKPSQTVSRVQQLADKLPRHICTAMMLRP